MSDEEYAVLIIDTRSQNSRAIAWFESSHDAIVYAKDKNLANGNPNLVYRAVKTDGGFFVSLTGESLYE